MLERKSCIWVPSLFSPQEPWESRGSEALGVNCKMGTSGSTHRPVGCSGTEYVRVPRIALPEERVLSDR